MSCNNCLRKSLLSTGAPGWWGEGEGEREREREREREGERERGRGWGGGRKTSGGDGSE